MAKRFSVPEQQSQAFDDYEIEQELENSQVAGMAYDPKTGNEIYYVPDDDEEVVNDKFKKFRQYSKKAKAKALSYEDDDDDDSQSNEDCRVVTNDNDSKAAAERPKNLKVVYATLNKIAHPNNSPKNAKALPTGPPNVDSIKTAKSVPTTPQSPASPTPSEAPSELMHPEHLPDLSVPAPSYTTKKTVITEDETTSSVQEIGGEMRATVKRRSDQQVLESG